MTVIAEGVFRTIPAVIWQEGFKMVTTIVSALVVAFVATFYLKKKDEITRVAGVILEKRINSEQKILDFLENASFHLEMPRPESALMYELLVRMELAQPHDRDIQYAKIFGSTELFREFFKAFEEVISTNKLWLSQKVLRHLFLMQSYFSWVNALVVTVNHVPLPEGQKLSRDEMDQLGDKILLVAGASLDNEVNGLIAELEVLMVDSVYHLDLKRPRKSFMRNGMLNRDTLKTLRTLSRRTLLGTDRAKYVTMIMLMVYQKCGKEPSSGDIELFLQRLDEAAGVAD
ncbi:MAG: hypothetical protein WC124_10625 [Desulfoplanes sp.]